MYVYMYTHGLTSPESCLVAAEKYLRWFLIHTKQLYPRVELNRPHKGISAYICIHKFIVNVPYVHVYILYECIQASVELNRTGVTVRSEWYNQPFLRTTALVSIHMYA